MKAKNHIKKKTPGIVLLFFFLQVQLTSGQTVPVELMAGDKNLWYQHSVSKELETTEMGIFHTSSLHSFYDSELGDELMSQLYITLKIIKGLKIGIGGFYATAPGFHSSVNFQWGRKGKNYLWLIVPRVDLSKLPSYDLMLLAEYTPFLTKNLNLYSKFQTMLNYTKLVHNRSYQNFRLGLDVRILQFGFAMNLDAYGVNRTYHINYGLFAKKDFK
jgi:hypothetical protein